MTFHLTPAVERAIDFARRWQSVAGSATIDTPEVLLGLLSEPECRAARLLAEQGVTDARVRQQWPQLSAADATERTLAPAVELALELASDLLWEYPQPLALATEHLLLGLVVSDDPTGTWLRSQGFDPANFEATIHRLSGHFPGPLPFEVPSLSTGEIVVASPEPEAAAEVPLEVFRILDAAANRASEGLRVVEDYVRLGLNDRHLTIQFKELRHQLASLLQMIDSPARLAARETRLDVGTTVTTRDEQQRSSPQAVVTASFHRAQQALRSLEEYGKLIEPAFASGCENLRYRLYTLHKAVDTTTTARQRLDAAQLYLLVDGCEAPAALETLLQTVLAAGVDVVQLRDKHLGDRELLQRAHLVRKVTQGAGCLFIMNDRPDLARLSGADGVHVGQEELSVHECRAIVGPGLLVGVSTHSIEQARQAVLEGADYIGMGPTFPSQTKAFAEFPGLALIQQVSDEIALPAFAIGGITPANVSQVRAAGGHRVAVGAAITQAVDIRSAIEQLRQGLTCGLS